MNKHTSTETTPTFSDNRDWGIEYPYRDVEFEGTYTFAELVGLGQTSISNSYGWIQNRAAKVYAEAYETNERLAKRAVPRHRTNHQTILHPVTGAEIDVLVPRTRVQMIDEHGLNHKNSDGSAVHAEVVGLSVHEDGHLDTILAPAGVSDIEGFEEALQLGLIPVAYGTDTGMDTAEGLPILIVMSGEED